MYVVGGLRIWVFNFNKWYFILIMFVEFMFKCFWCFIVLLFEEEWDISGSIGIVNMVNLLWIDWVEIWIRFVFGDNLIN